MFKNRFEIKKNKYFYLKSSTTQPTICGHEIATVICIAGVDDAKRRASKQHLIDERRRAEKEPEVPVPPNISK